MSEQMSEELRQVIDRMIRNDPSLTTVDLSGKSNCTIIDCEVMTSCIGIYDLCFCVDVTLIVFSLGGACGVFAVCALLKRLVDQATESALLALPPLRGLWRRTRPCRR